MPKLNFNPSLHGFHFRNDFVTDVAGLRFGGLCGGLSLAVFNYYRNNRPVPTHRQSPNDFGTPDSLPPVGGRLRNYILDMQIKSFASILPFITVGATPEGNFTSSTTEFNLIKQRIDRGQFVLLGMRGIDDLLKGHQTLVYGYEDGAVKRLIMYDSNHPDKEIAMDLDPATRTLIHRDAGSNSATGDRYASYFLQLPLDPNNPDIFTEADRPSYADLAISASSTSFAGSSISLTPADTLRYEFRVRNFGESKATFNHLHIYVRDPLGQNRDVLHGTQDARTSLEPGAEIVLHGQLTGFGNLPGTWEVGIYYLSNQGHPIPVPKYVVPNTQNNFRFNVVSPQAVPSNWNIINGEAASDPVAVKNQGGVTEVFVRNARNMISRSRENAGNYLPLDTFSGNERFVGNVAAILNQGNKLEIFARSTNNQLYNRYQNNPNVSSLNDWSGWGSLGGNLKSDPAVTMNLDKRLEVFAIHQDDRVYKIYHRVFGGWWSGWEAMPGNLRFKGSPSASPDAAGRIHVVARGFDNAIYINFQTTPNGGYSGWMNFGGIGDGDPVITRRSDNRLAIFVRGTDGKLYHRYQLAPNGNWTNDWGLFTIQNIPALLNPRSKAAVSPDAGKKLIAVSAQGSQVKSVSETAIAPEWSVWHDQQHGRIISNPAIIHRTNPAEADVFVVSSNLQLNRAILRL